MTTPRFRPWVRAMAARDQAEESRTSTPLELLFDLCFAVAVSQAASELHHGLSRGHAAEALVAYGLVFFAIWWAWMNFTWFASAYDTDDVPYRWKVFLQISGVLVLAAGIPRAFERRDFAMVTLGYVIMRVGLVAHWLRAAHADPAHRRTSLRYAVGVVIVQTGWIALQLIPEGLWILGWCVLAPAELALPIWAERSRMTPWHPHHIVDRYCCFTLIVLGEAVLSSTVAIQTAIDEGHLSLSLMSIATGGLLVVFSMWWVYFDRPAERVLEDRRFVFVWGYGHLPVFAAVAAVGAGIELSIDAATGHTEVSPYEAALAVAIPLAVFILLVWSLLVRRLHPSVFATVTFFAATALVLIATVAPLPVFAVGAAASTLMLISLCLPATEVAGA
jgi:low temperature requirement protein LtrA